MVEATLCIPVIGKPVREILMGLKKKGFGCGKYTGFGGKIEPGETAPQAAIREMVEEASIVVDEKDLRNVGYITFVFPAKPEWNFGVHVFLVDKWQGEPLESDEMQPNWFSADAIPYAHMWDDGRYWLPPLLEGKRLEATFVFGDNNEKVVDCVLEVSEDNQPDNL